MIRGGTYAQLARRLAAGGTALLLAGAILLAGKPAFAESKNEDGPKPTAVIITSDELDEEISVTAEEDGADLFNAMLSQVSWLTGNTGKSGKPDAKKLGVKYTVVVRYQDKDKFTYDLYPLAEGGPRAFRPAKQPEGKTSDAWFFGRLNMPNALRLAGAPLPEQMDVMTGGIGGGERINEQEPVDPTGDFTSVLGDLQGMLLLNVGVLVLITGGLAGIAFLIRRRV